MNLKEKILNLLKVMNNIVKSNCSNMQNSVLKLLTIVGIIFTATTNVSAQSGNNEMLFTSGTTGNLTWMLYTNGSLIIKGNGTMPNYPAGDTPWNSYMSSISAITIEDGVTSIGNNAFRDGTNITTVKMPNSITIIRDNAFSECNKITEITFLATTPQQIEIRDNAFLNVAKLTCKLWVPDESVALYRFAVEWRDFIVGTISDYSTQIYDNEEVVATSNEPALLHFYRKRELVILPKRYDVFLDNTVVANTTSRWKATVTVSNFGEKTISADIDGRKAEVKINFVPGEVYYVRCNIDSKTVDTGRTRTTTDRNGRTSTSKVTEIQRTPILQLVAKSVGESEFNAIK